MPTPDVIRYNVNTYPVICDSPLQRSAPALRSVTEIAPKSPFLCLNRSPIRYSFRANAKVIRKRVKIALFSSATYVLWSQEKLKTILMDIFFWKGKRGVLSQEMCKWRMAMLRNYQEQPIKEKLNVLLLPTHCRNEFHY